MKANLDHGVGARDDRALCCVVLRCFGPVGYATRETGLVSCGACVCLSIHGQCS